MTAILTLPAAEVLAGTTRVTALEAAGFALDESPRGGVRVYRADEIALGLDGTPRVASYCVARRP